jgi:hypothetical protein
VTIEEGTNILVGTTGMVSFQLMKFLRMVVLKRVESLSFGTAKPLNESSIFFLAGPMSLLNPRLIRKISHRDAGSKLKASDLPDYIF